MVNQLNAAVSAISQNADTRERLIAQGAEPRPATPEEVRAFVASEIAKWGDVVQKSGAKMD